MKPMLGIGAVLIALGIGALAYQGITYTRRAQISNISHIETARKPDKTARSSSMVDRVGRSGGIALILLGITARR